LKDDSRGLYSALCTRIMLYHSHQSLNKQLGFTAFIDDAMKDPHSPFKRNTV